MTSRVARVEAARRHGKALEERVLSELRDGRLDRNVAGSAIAASLGISPSQYSRFERGLAGPVDIERASIALDCVGLHLSTRAFPGGPPIRDQASGRVIDRLRARCHPSITLVTEVPFPDRGDLRAWDAVAVAPSWRHHFEVETRPRDLQALERRIALKARDGGVGGASLVLLDSRHNREFAAAFAERLGARFPVPASVTLASLREGVDPGLGSVILL